MEVWPSEGQAGTSISGPWTRAGSHRHGHVTGGDLSPLPQTLPLSPTLYCLSLVPSLPTSSHTSAVAVVIFVPPEAPTTILTFFILSTKIEGHIEDIGCLPVGDTDTTEAQLSTCSLQTSSSCSVSTLRASVSTLLTQLTSCSVLGFPLSPAPISSLLLQRKASPWSFTQRLKVPSSTVLSQLGLSAMQLPPTHHRTSLPVLSLPCHSPKRGVQGGSRIPACFSSNKLGLQEAAAEQAGCLG